MEFSSLVDIFLHLDTHLAAVVERHGMWVYALLFAIIFVETGLVGTALFAAFLVYLFRRLGRLRSIGRSLGSARIRPLAWGMTAALVGTIAANAFYLTMSFYYFFAFALLALAAPVVFSRRLA